MKNKAKIALGVGAVTGGALIFTAIERSKETMKVDDFGHIAEGKCMGDTEPVREMSPEEVEKISSIIKGMSVDEIRVVLRNVDIQLILDEIAARLEMHDQFARSIQDALECLPK